MTGCFVSAKKIHIFAVCLYRWNFYEKGVVYIVSDRGDSYDVGL